jgi:DNA-binding MarR family transcriptional regulator
MKTQDNQLPDCMIFLLSKAYQKGHGLVQKRLRPHGLTNLQYVVLEVLWKVKELTANELGRMLNIDKATLSGVLDRMADGGWLSRQQDPNDKRVNRISLNEKAYQVKDALVEERKKANDELLAGFSLEERMLLKRLLADLI